MTDNLHESLSALMDNEGDELEVRRILKAYTEDESLSGKWQRYHLVSAALKQEVHSRPATDLLAGIREQLEHEEPPVRETPAAAVPGNRFARYLSQGAIAASVMFAVLFTADVVMVADNNAPGAAIGELAGNDGQPSLEFTGQLNPDTATQVAVETGMDEAERDRLRRVVSQELDETLQLEMPANFVPQNIRPE